MNIGWNGAMPPALPPLDLPDWLRLGLRAAPVVAVTAVCLAAFLFLRGVDAMRGAPQARFAPRALKVWGRAALALAGLRLERRGTPMRQPGALVANHASWLDIVVLLACAPAAVFVSKSEVAGWPVIGPIGRIIGTVFIDRRAVEARRQGEMLRRRLARGDRLCLFPEGTSTDGRRVLGFKSSLFGVFLEASLREAVWVQPVSIRYRPRAGLPAEFYGWWGTMDFGSHLVSVLARSRGGVVRVELHPPLRAADFAHRKALARAAQGMVATGFEAVVPQDMSGNTRDIAINLLF